MASLLIPMSVMGWNDLELEHDRTRRSIVVSMAVLLACMVATSNGGRTSENAEVKRLGAYQASNFNPAR
jgi:hypothetical protein